MGAWLTWVARTPGGLICHPAVLVAIATLVVNDHILKPLAPGPLTGKLSDFAGLLVFPALIVATTELIGLMTWRWRALSREHLTAIAVLLTGACFAAIKTLPGATALYNEALGAAQWLVGGGPLTGAGIVPTAGVTDPTDLIALPALAVMYLVAAGRPSLPISQAPRVPHRLSAASLALLLVAGLASIATSPAMRSSSTEYAEEIRLTPEAPVAVRLLTVTIANRDAELSSIDMVASATSRNGNVISDTPGVRVSLLANPDEPDVIPSSDYFAPALSFFEACRNTCTRAAVAIVRLVDPGVHAAGVEVATSLEIGLRAGASEEGTGPVDIDLAIANNPDRAFNGAPRSISARHTGHVHIGADAEAMTSDFDIVIAAEALAEPYGFPLVGVALVGHDAKTAVGHPNAHSTFMTFTTSIDQPLFEPGSFVDVGTGWLDEPAPPPSEVDLLRWCSPGRECRIRVTLESRYDAWMNEPDDTGAAAVAGSIDFDWYVDVRLDAYDGRSLPEGAIRIEAAD